MARTYSYDVKNVVQTINGVYLTGFADAGKVELEKNENNIEPYVGVDGIVHYSKINDRSGTATLKFASTSPSLDYLRELAENNEEFTYTLADLNENGKNIASDGCVILKNLNYIVNKAVEEVEVEIFIPYMY